MADGGARTPGPGEDQRGETPLHARPSSPQGASYVDTNPPEPEPARRSWWPFCLIGGALGCGCLIIVALAFGLIGGVSWTLFGDQQDQTPANAISLPPGPGVFPPGNGGAPGAAPVAPRPGGAPGPESAMAWAANHRPDRQATIDDHSDDWTWVRLLMGPTASEWMTWVEIQWNTPSGRYGLLDEGPIGVDGAGPGEAPSLHQPGEDGAREAALAYAEQPNWVARVDKHSSDWHTAAVSVGPPASEFVYLVSLQWDDSMGAYSLISMDSLDYPGM